MQDTEGVPAPGLRLSWPGELLLSLFGIMWTRPDGDSERGKQPDRSSPETEQTVQESLLTASAVVTSSRASEDTTELAEKVAEQVAKSLMPALKSQMEAFAEV